MEIGNDALAQAREELAQVRQQAEREQRHLKAEIARLEKHWADAREALGEAEARAYRAALALEDERQELARVRADERRWGNRALLLEEELIRVGRAYEDLAATRAKL